MNVTNWYLSFMPSNFGQVISNQTCTVCSFDFEIRYTRLDLCTSIRLRCQVFFFQLAADPDMNVKNGAELLDRLVKVG